MTKPNLLSAALLIAALLTTPAMARQGQLTSQRTVTSSPIAIPHSAAQARLRNRASDLRGFEERDMWGHWGAYYGPMVVAP